MISTLKAAIRFTLITTVALGLAYPLLMTALAHTLWKDKADGQMIIRQGSVVGSAIIGQSFTTDSYFHGRPSAAGNGYDAANSSGSNYAPSNKKLVDRINSDVASNQKDHPDTAVPIDLATPPPPAPTPDTTPAAAECQVTRVARVRRLPESTIRTLVQQ